MVRKIYKLPHARYYQTRRGAWGATIRKWEKIVKKLEQGYEVVNYADESCAFCQTYPACDECPIGKATGQRYCKGTPYYHFGYEVDRREYQKALKEAREMLRFLRKLKRSEDEKHG